MILPEGHDSIIQQENVDELPISTIALNLLEQKQASYLWALRFPSGAILEQRFRLDTHVVWDARGAGVVLREDANTAEPWGNFRRVGEHDIVWATAVTNTAFALSQIEVTFGGYG
jgi:hypothetical protein